MSADSSPVRAAIRDDTHRITQRTISDMRRVLGSGTLAGAAFVGGCYYVESRKASLDSYKRKRGDPPLPPAEHHAGGSSDSLSARTLGAVVRTGLGWYSKTVMQVLNTQVEVNVEPLRELIANGKDGRGGRGLVTACNHVTAVDDPGVICTLCSWWSFPCKPRTIRWQMCATDRCFNIEALLPFFEAGRVLPIARGGGLHHPFIGDIIAKIEAGDWARP